MKPKRTPAEREHDLPQIAAMYLKGRYQAEIAEHLGKHRKYSLTRQMIGYDIKALHRRWLASSLVDYDQAKAKEIAVIDHLERTYWAEYEVSKGPVTRKKVAKKVDGKLTEATQEIGAGLGDVRFLQGVQWCIDRRIKVMGLDAPIKNETAGETLISVVYDGDRTDGQPPAAASETN